MNQFLVILLRWKNWKKRKSSNLPQGQRIIPFSQAVMARLVCSEELDSTNVPLELQSNWSARPQVHINQAGDNPHSYYGLKALEKWGGEWGVGGVWIIVFEYREYNTQLVVCMNTHNHVRYLRQEAITFSHCSREPQAKPNNKQNKRAKQLL